MTHPQTFTLHITEETHHDITVTLPEELLADIREAGIDTSDTRGVAKWLTDNLDPDDRLITDVISDATISAVNGREVTDVAPGPHEHIWVLKQNVTTKGTVMPARKVCDCGAATEVADGEAPGREIGCDNEFCKSMRALDQTKYVALEARAEQAETALADERDRHNDTRITRERLRAALADITRQRDGWKAHYKALREDVVSERTKLGQVGPSEAHYVTYKAAVILDGIMARADERGQR